MSTHQNLFFVGPTGAGKTTIGKRVAAYFGMTFVDLDQEIEKRTGVDVSLIFEIEGEAGFRRRESAALKEFAESDDIVLATGGGAVLAKENQALLRSHGFVVYLQTTVDRQLERLERDRQRPLLQAPNRREILENMAQLRDPIYQSVADLTVVSEPVSVTQMARQVIRQLKESDYARR